MPAPIAAKPILIRHAEKVLRGDGDAVVGSDIDILIKDGRISAIGSSLDAPAGTQIIEGRNRLAAPGLVNAHWHSPMSFLTGTADRMNHKVLMWDNQVGTANRSQEEVYLSAVLGCLQMLKSGTTGVLDHFPEQRFALQDVATVVRAFRDCGMRAAVGLRIFDGEYSDIMPPANRITPALKRALETGNSLAPRPLQETLDIVDEAIRTLDKTEGRIRIFPAPSNPVRCSDALLVASEKIAQRYDTGVHCHMLETQTQATLARQLYGRDMVEHMQAIGAFSDRWSCAHCNWLSDTDIAIMAEVGAVVVLNPESNLKIGSGVPPIPKLIAAGVTCALGTDGAISNDNLILQDAMQLAAIVHRPLEQDRNRWVTVGDVIAMATTGGGKAIREPDIGRIVPGAKADIVLYDLNDFAWVPLNDPAQQWVFSDRGQSVRTVIVDGRLVVDQGRSLFIDEDAIVAEAKDVLAHIRERNAGVRAIAEAVAAVE